MSDGLRNERARQRHRQWKKEQCGCVSVPASAVASEASTMHIARVELNEQNHYGFAVCEKCAGDPEFERLMQYQEKPELPGRDDQSSTYVLFLEDEARAVRPISPDGDRDRLKDVSVKATQTSFQDIEHKPDTADKDKKDKKKKLISEFFYIPVRERSRSRSPKTGKSKPKFLGQLTDEPRVLVGQESKPLISKLHATSEKPTTSEVKQSKTKVLGSKSKYQNKPGSKKSSLRAGTDSNKSLRGNADSKVLSQKSKSTDKFDVDSPKSQKGDSSSEHLLDTPSGSNRYLYVRGRQQKQ